MNRSKKDTWIKTALTAALIIAILIIVALSSYYTKRLHEKDVLMSEFSTELEKINGTMDGMRVALTSKTSEPQDDFTQPPSEIVYANTPCSEDRLRSERNALRVQLEDVQDLLKGEREVTAALYNDNTFLAQVIDSLEAISKPITTTIKPLEPAQIAYTLVHKDGVAIQIATTDPNVEFLNWTIKAKDLGVEVKQVNVEKEGKVDTPFSKNKGAKTKSVIMFKNKHVINDTPMSIHPTGALMYLPTEGAYVTVLPEASGEPHNPNFIENLEFVLSYGVYGGKSLLPSHYDYPHNSTRPNVSRSWNSFDKFRIGHGFQFGIKLIGVKPFKK